MIQYLKENQFNIGLVLIMQSLSITNLVRAMAERNIVGMSDMMMTIGLLFMFNYRQLLKLRVYRCGKHMYLVLLFIAYTLFRAYSTENLYGKAGNPVYSLFGLVIGFALMTNKEWKHSENFVPLLFYVSGFLSVLCAWYFTSGFTDFNASINGIYDDTETVIADRLTISTIPANSLMACLCHKSRTARERLLKIVFVITDILCMFIVVRRSLVITVILTTVYVLLRNAMTLKKVTIRQLGKWLLGLLVGILIFVALARTPWFLERLDGLWATVQKAVSTLVGNTNLGVDASAQTRVSLRRMIFAEYHNYSPIEILFGKGYMYKYLDFPLLQAFIDLGIMGGGDFPVSCFPLPFFMFMQVSSQ